MELEQIEQEIINCKKCSLYKTRKNPVVGHGLKNAQIMFVGEAPGFHEDEKGEPFIGAAGKILDEVLKSAKLSREDIYITNIIKCRPPKNRNPSKEEIKLCTPYLDKQIAIIKPKIICCLGNFSTKFIMEKYNLESKIKGITKIHGEVFEVSTFDDILKIIPMFHPAVATYDIRKLDLLKKDALVLYKLNNLTKP